MEVLYCMGLGYLVGMLNPAYMISKLKGFDIREVGSGNAGATNVYLTMGFHVGILVVLFDILKAVFAVTLAAWWFPQFSAAYALTGLFCVIGHVFPFYMGFRGGKGTACLAGIVVSYSVKLFLLMVLAAFVAAMITDYIGFAPVVAPVAFAILYGGTTRNLGAFLCLVAMAAVMVNRHWENLRRIRQGTELHFSYLWKDQEARTAELQRIRDNGGEMPAMK